MSVVFLDCETTGLDPDRHEIWDIAIIEEDGTEHEWHIRPKRPDRADPTALRLTHFYERTATTGWKWGSSKTNPYSFFPPSPNGEDARSDTARQIAHLTAGKHIVGAVPSFDATFLSKFLIDNGQREAWHYHLLDVETMIAGRLQLEPPLNSDELSLAIGVDPAAFDRHTALGDARWVRTQYKAVLTHGK